MIGQMRLLASIIVLLCAAMSSAHAEKRVALVIGNSAYKHIPSLPNPANDARLIADTLKGLGFDLTGGGARFDLDKASLDRSVQEFGRAIQGADVALFYYAGHGVQVRGHNYLVPVAANPAREADVDFQMLDANLVLRQMEGSGARLNVVVLDACRNNPFGGRGLRSAGSGLAQMQAPEGTLISFATQPGAVALDGTGSNSPYTQALAETIRKPGLDIFRTFNAVGLAVKQATAGQQQPWVSSSPITGDFFFAGRVEDAKPQADDGKLAAMQKELEALKLQLDKKPEAKTQPRDDGKLAALQAEVERLKKQLETKPEAKTPEEPKAKVAVGTFEQPKLSTPGRGLKPGDEFQDCDACPLMVVVPAGNFVMGAPRGEKDAAVDQFPQRRVSIARPFAVSKYEVTFSEWDACYDDGGCLGHRAGDKGWGRGRQPVVDVSWLEARSHAIWLTRRTNKSYRLPTEAEWEYAARAGTATPFHTGQRITTDQANFDGQYLYNGSSKGISRGRPVTVGSFAPNSFGLHDMHGNVMEWVEDCYAPNYSGAPADGDINRNCDYSKRVARGGGWINHPAYIRSAFRWPGNPSDRFDSLGFRVVRALTAEELGK
ncbi:MAG: SUMF1/EgtB/PvdO family nonheme iron enzyme [Pseudomonadota bacterium]|nr:SUMF1/EgtB/PvdO family nonheme iron enzyme [Pseudomonadota bacterium]